MKIIDNKIFIIIMIATICITGTVTAATIYNANEIKYEKDTITNVEDALNDLYDNSKITIPTQWDNTLRIEYAGTINTPALTGVYLVTRTASSGSGATFNSIPSGAHIIMSYPNMSIYQHYGTGDAYIIKCDNTVITTTVSGNIYELVVSYVKIAD